jgi:hypothetical protein
MPSINFVLNQIHYDATTFQKCKLICKLIIKMYFFCFHANDDQFNEKLVLPTTLSDQGDSDKKTQISHKQRTLLQSNKRNKIKKCQRKEKQIGSDDLKEPNEKSHRLLMSFTRVPAQSDRREESRGLISNSQQQKLKNKEEGHKI